MEIGDLSLTIEIFGESKTKIIPLFVFVLRLFIKSFVTLNGFYDGNEDFVVDRGAICQILFCQFHTHTDG